MDFEDIAKEVFAVLETGRQSTPFSKVYPDFGLKEAYRVTAASERREKRMASVRSAARSASPTAHLGRIWRLRADLGLCLRPHGPGSHHQPPEVSSTAWPNPASSRKSSLALPPRPQPGMDERELIRCIDWIAHGFEIVQSIFRNWSFQAADTVAAYGLHGRLFIGPRHSAEARRDDGRASFRVSKSIFSATEP